MEEQKPRADSRARFVVGTVVHSLAFVAFLAAMLFGITAIFTYAQGSVSEEPFEGFGTAFGAVILFIVFLISGGIHQILGYIGIPILFPCRVTESRVRRTAARVLIISQAVALALDFVLFAAILLIFRAS
ncbi:MAG: hypothetical protein IJ009_02770 [Clostridia bacterium]|nr:hypothetical protein [Clostridia bacterium]